MDRTLRSILWILVALVVLSSFSTGWFFVAKERLYNEYLNLEDLFKVTVERMDKKLAASKEENKDLQAKLESVASELRVLEANHRDLEFRNRELAEEKNDLEKELVRTRKGKFYVERKLKEVESDKFVASLLRENASLEVEIKRAKDLLDPKEMEVERLKKANKDLDVQLTQIKERTISLERELRDSTQVAEVLSRDLLNEKDRNTERNRNYENIQVENRLLKTKVLDLENTADEYDRLLSEKKNLEIKISRLERNIEDKERQIDRLKVAMDRQEKASKEIRAEAYHAPEEVNLPPIVLQKEHASTSSFSSPSLDRIGETGLRGRVVTVNQEHDFVVVDLGRQDGIEVGNTFKVYRNNALIGRVEVIQARERISACDIRDLNEGCYLKVDDVVVK